MEYGIQRIINNKFHLRDYLVDKAIENNTNITINHSTGSMILTPQDLAKGIRRTRVYESKIYRGKTYKLLEYNWNPITN